MFARTCRLLIPAVLVFALAPRPASAQTNEEVFQQFQWNFSTPGARANGMGRAFIGLADDATAAITNPAGLMSLTRPQLYVEFKASDIRTQRYLDVNSLFTQAATNISTNVNSLSFFDVAAPLGSHMAVAFTRHEFLNTKETFHQTTRLVPNTSGTFLTFPLDASVDFKGVSYAGSIAVAPHPMVRVGLTLSVNQLSGTATSTRYNFRSTGSGQFAWGENSGRSGEQINVNQSLMDDTNTKIGFDIGALFRPNEKVAIGFTYSRLGKFELEENFQFNPGYPGAGVIGGSNQTFQSFTGFPEAIPFNVPSRLGFGISARPTTRLTVVADIVHITYSDLASPITPILDFTTLTGNEFSIDNGTEFHAGGEFNLIQGRNPVFVRAGVFTNPYHGLKFAGGLSNQNLNAYYSAQFNLGTPGTDTGATFGGGIVAGRRGQIDAAYVHSKSLREFVVSAAVRF